MPPLIRIAFVEDSYAVLKRLEKAGLLREIQEVTKNVGFPLAEYVQQRLKHLLSKEHKFNIGASGRASENFIIEQGRSGIGRVEWRVSEGGLTFANAIIRRGINAGETPGPEGVKQWESEKGIKLKSFYDPIKQFVNAYSRKSSTGTTVNVKAYTRLFAGEAKKRDEDPYYRVASSLYKHGSHRPAEPSKNVQGSHWMRLGKPGEGKFDYVAYLMNQHSNFSTHVNKLKAEGNQAIIDYIMTGKKTKGHRAFGGGL